MGSGLYDFCGFERRKKSSNIAIKYYYYEQGSLNCRNVSYEQLIEKIENISRVLRSHLPESQKELLIGSVGQTAIESIILQLWYQLLFPSFFLKSIFCSLSKLGHAFMPIKGASNDRLRDKEFLYGTVCLDEQGRLKVEINENYKIPLFERSISYLMQTSGTTRGRPKTIFVTEDTILSNLESIKTRLYPSGTSFRSCAQLAPLHFDPSIIEIYLTLSSGAILVIPDHQSILKSPEILFQVLEKESVELLMMTPTLWNTFSVQQQLELTKDCNRHIVFGGEKFPSVKFIETKCLAKLWNIYGVTEMSVWASLTKYDFSAPASIEHFLADTEFEISDENELILKSEKRACYIDSELKNRIFTGDLITFEQGKMLYRGRKDFQIKRHGHRIQLEALEKSLIDGLNDISACCFIYCESSDELLCFIVMDPPRISKIQVLFEEKWTSAERPDKCFILKALPLNENGKVDRRLLEVNAINGEYEESTFPALSSISILKFCLDEASNDPANLPSNLLQCFSSLLNREVSEEMYFLAIGGNSFLAHQIVSEVAKTLSDEDDKVLRSTLTAALLNASIGDFISVIQRWLNKEGLFSDDLIGEQIEANVVPLPISSQIVIMESDMIYPASFICDQLINYRLPMEKCIDASPAVGRFLMNNLPYNIAYIGSHSGLFYAVNLEESTVIWQERLIGRIECSAAISSNSTGDPIVAVGTSSGYFYAFNAVTGEILFEFKSRQMIKSTPVFWGGAKHSVFVVDYDGIVRCFDVDSWELEWECNIREPVLSRMLIINSRKILVVASLHGNLHVIDVETGIVKRRVPLGSPVFADILYVDKLESLLVITVNGTLYLLDSRDFEVLQSFNEVNGPVFAAPVILNDDSEVTIFIGTHQKELVSVKIKDGAMSLHDRLFLKENITAVPALIGPSTLLVITIDGVLHEVETNDKLKLRQIQRVAGQVFSSPQLFNNRSNELGIVFGSRDDSFHIIKLLISKSAI